MTNHRSPVPPPESMTPSPAPDRLTALPFLLPRNDHDALCFLNGALAVLDLMQPWQVAHLRRDVLAARQTFLDKGDTHGLAD